MADYAVTNGSQQGWTDAKDGTRHVDQRTTRRVTFPGESRSWDLTVGVDVESYEAGGVRRLRRTNRNRRIALLSPSSLGEKALRIYRRRWAIETLFHVRALDRSRPRPQTIQAHVVQFSCHVLANTLGVCTRIIIESGPQGADTDATFISITQVLVEIACEPS